MKLSWLIRGFPEYGKAEEVSLKCAGGGEMGVHIIYV